jgi:hypothetical protein
MDMHEINGKGVDTIMKLSLAKKTMDNITVVVISF